MRPASADEHRRIVSDEIGPLPWEPRQLSRVIVKIDAVFAPRLTTFDELEDAPAQRMEGMRDAKGLRRTARQRCN
jgi:hypothetical protein